jgi:rhodanese-related sulfurtransferase
MFASNLSLSRNVAPSYGHISPLDLETLGGSTHIVDVREPFEFSGDLGHIPGAELVPLASLAAASESWNRDSDIVVVCRSGGRSARGCALLTSAGFRHVRNLDGGMLAYNHMGLPVQR